MAPADSASSNVTRDEYVALVTSNRSLVRVLHEDDAVYELLDRETGDRFRIRQEELFLPVETRVRVPNERPRVIIERFDCPLEDVSGLFF